MKINTSRFGEIEIDKELIFNFIEPILGYEHLKYFTLVNHLDDSPFKWLQSVENAEIAFPVTSPAFFGISYEFMIPEENTKILELTSAENLLSMNIVCIPKGQPEKATVNLLGPIVVNIINKKAMQLILPDTNYSIQHKLFPNGIEELATTAQPAESKA